MDSARDLGTCPPVGFEDRELRVQVTERLNLVTELEVKDFKYAIWCYVLASEYARSPCTFTSDLLLI
jgi:hypothetical protein